MTKNNNDVTKSRTRSKSIVRKPLRDVSNGGVKSIPKSAMKPPTTVNRGGKHQIGDEALDRLFLVHSDLSSLIHQIDELIVQALKPTSKKHKKEIDSFADALSEIHISLKPKIDRFRKELSIHNPESNPIPENEHSSPPCKVIIPSINENTSNLIASPEENKWESLVSPSPLVSWRDSNIDREKQLFLLTPLPQPKAFSSIPDSVKSNKPSQLCEGVSVIPNTDERECNKIPVQSNSSAFIMTPRLKTSPPKSCVLLEPVSKFAHKFRKSTPFPVGVKLSSLLQESDSSSSSNEGTDCVNMNYPELFGLKNGYNFGTRKVVEDSSPNWLMSPPKTCILMEPPENKTIPSLNIVQEMGSLALEIGKKEMIESTPLKNEHESNMKMGKQPGENTLKRELWTKFDAVSNYGNRIQKNVQKGFLDRLDEVSREE